MTGFKNFILRGNLVELATAFIMAAAFAKVVDATVDLILGLIGKIGGQPDFSGWRPGDLAVGAWITAIISFIIIAAVVYYLIVLPYTEAKERLFPTPEAQEGTPEEIVLLTQIRDSLAGSPGRPV